MKRIFLAILMVSALAGICAASDFSEDKSSHFIVYYKDVPKEFVDTVIDYAERYYDELTDKLGFTRYDYWTWDNRAKIYIYPDKETYIGETKQPEWSSGLVSYRRKTIWTYPRGAGFFDSLLPHEIGHIVFREVVGGRSVPLWLEEGVAQYLEQAKRLGSEKVLLKAIEEDTFIPFDELNKITPSSLKKRDDVEIFYAESINIITYLIDKFGTSAFNDFLGKLNSGKPLDKALSFAYFDIRSASNLGELWESHLKDKVKGKKRVW